MRDIFLFRFWINVFAASSLASFLNLLGLDGFAPITIYIINFLFNLVLLSCSFELVKLKYNLNLIKNFIKIFLTWIFLYSVTSFVNQSFENEAINFKMEIFILLSVLNCIFFSIQIIILEKLELRKTENILIITDNQKKKYKFQNAFIIKIFSLEEADELVNDLKTFNISKVIFDVNPNNLKKVFLIKNKIDQFPLDIFLANKKDLNFSKDLIIDYIGSEMISLSSGTIPTRPIAYLVKRGTDFFVALLLLLLLAPFFVLLSIVIKIESPGPVIFSQMRNGNHGKIFNLYKFRSMKQHDQKSIKQATKEDKRITKFGAFIRKTSIDELPQLINVILGDMSLVGPRPHAAQHNKYYKEIIDDYMLRHRSKPGMTGLAQVNGFRGETKNIQQMKERVKLDLKYIHEWSLWLDFKILVMTPIALFKDEAY